jgi:hypothetical protein
MWLRDSLPYDLPGVRILTYGYDSHLVGGQSFQGVEALATEFRTHIAAIRRTTNVSRENICDISCMLTWNRRAVL